MSTLNEEIVRLETAKINISNVLIARGVSVPSNATLDTYHNLINSIKGGTSSEEVTATKANVLAGTTTITSDSNDEIVEGTMPNNGAVSQSLNAGVSYTIPKGYHDGNGKITANSLASQTDGTATSAHILKDQTAYVDGVKITGTMENNGAVAPSALGAGGSYTIPAGYHNGSGKVTVQSLATMTASGDATAAQILSGKKAYVDGNLITGSMTDQGAKTSSLNCGGSYTIPAGYHNGSGKITANSLSSQTDATATAAYIKSGYTAWVKGSKLTGSMAVKSAINFKATAQSATVIRISWTNPSKGPWEGVFIQMSTSGNPGVSGGTQKYKGKGTNATAGGSNYVDITGLSAGTTYYFTCTSYATGLGNGSSYNVSAKTTGLLLYSYGNNPAGFTYTYNSSAGVSGNGITFKSDHILVDSGSCRTIYSSVYKETLYKSYTRLCADIIFPNAITPQYDSWTGYIRLHAGISNTDGSSSVYSEASIPSAGSLTTFKTSLANASSGNSNNGLDVYIEVAWKTGSTVRNHTYPQAKYYRIWLE